MTQEQYEILIKEGWKQLPNDSHIWFYPAGPPGCPTYMGESDAIDHADESLRNKNEDDTERQRDDLSGFYAE